jgi:hypothetical protein
MKKKLSLLLFALLVHAAVWAQSSGNLTSTINIQAVMQLTLSNSTASITFSTPDQYSSEYVLTSFNSVKIKSNQNWNLAVSATSSVFTASGTFSTSNMPASLCKLGVTGQTATVSLSTTSQLLATGNRGSDATAGNNFDITMKINPGYNYGAGIYSIGLIYTLTAK